MQNEVQEKVGIAFYVLMTKKNFAVWNYWYRGTSQTASCRCIRWFLHVFGFRFFSSSRIFNWKAHQWLSGAEVGARWPRDPFAILCQSVGSSV